MKRTLVHNWYCIGLLLFGVAMSSNFAFAQSSAQDSTPDNWRDCPHGYQPIGRCPICSRRKNEVEKDRDCADAKAFLRKKGYQTDDHVQSMSCIAAKLVAGTFGWKSKEERRLEAELEAERQRRDAEWEKQLAEWEVDGQIRQIERERQRAEWQAQWRADRNETTEPFAKSLASLQDSIDQLLKGAEFHGMSGRPDAATAARENAARVGEMMELLKVPDGLVGSGDLAGAWEIGESPKQPLHDNLPQTIINDRKQLLNDVLGGLSPASDEELRYSLNASDSRSLVDKVLGDLGSVGASSSPIGRTGGAFTKGGSRSDIQLDAFDSMSGSSGAVGLSAIDERRSSSANLHTVRQEARLVLEDAVRHGQQMSHPALLPHGRDAIPIDVSLELTDGGLLKVSHAAKSGAGMTDSTVVFQNSGMNTDNSVAIRNGVLTGQVRGADVVLINNRDEVGVFDSIDWSGLQDRWFPASLAENESAWVMAEQTEQVLRTGSKVEWWVHSEGVINADNAFATLKKRLETDASVSPSQRQEMLSNLHVIAFGPGVKGRFEGAGSVYTLIHEGDAVGNWAGGGPNYPPPSFMAFGEYHSYEMYLKHYEPGMNRKSGTKIIKSPSIFDDLDRFDVAPVP